MIEDNRGLKFFLGCLALFLGVRWIITGKVLYAVQACQSAESAAIVVSNILPLVLEFLVGLGTVLLFTFTTAGTFTWAVVRWAFDFVTGKPTASLSDATAAASGGEIAKLTSAVRILNTQVKSLIEFRNRIEPPPPPPETQEEKIARLEALVSELASKPKPAAKAVAK